MRGVGVGAAIFLSALAGCVNPLDSPTASDCSTLPVSTIMLTRSDGLSDPHQPWDALLRIDQSPANLTIDPSAVPAGWNPEIRAFGRADASSLFASLRLEPDGTPTGGELHVSWEPPLNPCGDAPAGMLHATVSPPGPGELAAPGKGTHVFTAGFHENGTLFYTNMDRVNNDTNWARVGWYEYGGGDSLPVYVYDKSRGEKPPAWGYATPPDFIPGAQSMTVTPWDYFTTIEGFNEALKGLSTNTARVVHIPPEQAYTLPGRESHPLYGSALIFYIELVDVVDVPCPASPAPSASSPCDTPPSPLS